MLFFVLFSYDVLRSTSKCLDDGYLRWSDLSNEMFCMFNCETTYLLLVSPFAPTREVAEMGMDLLHLSTDSESKAAAVRSK